MEYENVFYFNVLNDIGGVESFFYYLAKQYNNMTVFYTAGNNAQIERLSNLIEVHKYRGQKIKCKRVFFNYSYQIIENVEAEEYIQIIHADYKRQELEPNIHPKITKFVGVSKEVCKSIKELTGIECELIYNPISIDKPKKILKLISATRLTEEKGKDLMIRLGNILDKKGIPYIWLIFTNDKQEINNPNIVYMNPRLDITTYMQEADFLVQLSYSEAYCYSVVESLLLGKPVIVTDLPIYKEIGLTSSNSIKLDIYFNDIDEKKLYKDYEFKYTPKKSNWDKYLNNKGKYNAKEKIFVKPLITYDDLVEGARKTEYDEPFKVTRARGNYLIDLGYVKEVTK